MRLFLAINLPSDVRERLHEAAGPLRELDAGVAWVGAERLHLTLKFLGELPESAVPPLADMVGGVAARHGEVELAIGGFGASPSLSRPRVFWAGIAPDPRLELLHHDVETACAALGYQVEARAFRPHVTLGRVRTRIESEAARRALSLAARQADYREEIGVESVDLMRSELGPGGSRYTILAAGPLRPA